MYVTIKHSPEPDTYPSVDIHDGVPSLEDMYSHIGCRLVEPMDLVTNDRTGRRITLWIDEEGTFIDNARCGLYLMRQGQNQDTSLYGDLVISADQGSETVPLLPHESAQIAAWFETKDPPVESGNWGHQHPTELKLVRRNLYTPAPFEWDASAITDEQAEADYLTSIHAPRSI